jgi:hypothetical protein
MNHSKKARNSKISNSPGDLLSHSSAFKSSVVSRKSDYIEKIDVIDDGSDIKINVVSKLFPPVIEEECLINTKKSIEVIENKLQSMLTAEFHKLPSLDDSDEDNKLADLIIKDLKSRYSDLLSFSISFNKSLSNYTSNNNPKFSHLERFV